ncbi:pilin [Patescibacteria group bacterium]|nr:pilin [Patescibacteria group bacterium]MCL5410179.1 pilin [Patescibacteria group bacterium]
MRELALTLPGGSSPIEPPANFDTATFSSLASSVSAFLNLIFTVVAFLMFFWLIWGAFQYIFAGGDKDKLAAARKRLTYAIVGFLIAAIAFLVAPWVENIFQPANVNVQDVSSPPTLDFSNPGGGGSW